jgi:hypothetical protein
VKLLCTNWSKPSIAAEYATSDDFWKLLTDGTAGLYLLSYLLTGNLKKAEQCFLAGIEDAAKSNAVFKEWARAWTRRAMLSCCRAPSISRGIADVLLGFINRSSLPSSGRPTHTSRTGSVKFSSLAASSPSNAIVLPLSEAALFDLHCVFYSPFPSLWDRTEPCPSPISRSRRHQLGMFSVPRNRCMSLTGTRTEHPRGRNGFGRMQCQARFCHSRAIDHRAPALGNAGYRQS